MNELLVGGGVLCLIAAIVGGGMELAKVGKVPVINSILRQMLLGIVGLGMLVVGSGRGDAWWSRLTSEAPYPASIDMPNGEVFKFETNNYTMHVPKGQTQDLSDYGESDESLPACANLKTHFSWQVRSPYPTQGAEIVLISERMGSRETLGHGASGQAVHGGCYHYEVQNSSAFDIDLAMRILFTESDE